MNEFNTLWNNCGRGNLAFFDGKEKLNWGMMACSFWLKGNWFIYGS